MNSNNFYIVAGIYGSGKTTFCKNKNINMLSIDDITNYTKLITNYNKISKWINRTKNTNENFYLDGYIFDIDPELDTLKNILDSNGQFEISILFMYANNITLYRTAFKEKLCHGKIFTELSESNDAFLSNHIKQKILNIINIITKLQINITYLCRSDDNTIKESSLDELMEFINNL